MLIKNGFFRVVTTYDFDIVIWKWFQHALIECRYTFIWFPLLLERFWVVRDIILGHFAGLQSFMKVEKVLKSGVKMATSEEMSRKTNLEDINHTSRIYTLAELTSEEEILEGLGEV